MQYAYDRIGRMTDLYLPDKSSVKYIYNAAYLKEIQRYRYQQLFYQHYNIKHDLSGALLQSQLIGQAGTLDYKNNRLGSTIKIIHPHWNQQDKYDSLGRLIETATQDPIGNYQSTFTYNELNHLQKETGFTSHIYQTDSIHNRIQKNGITCSINPLNQLTDQNQCHYSYDLNGNLIQKVEENKTTQYTYDAFNRLIKVNSSESNTSYQYDSFNRRLVKSDKGDISKYFYQGQNEIGTIDCFEVIRECRILGIGIEADIGAAVALELYGKIFAPVHDRQGNIICLIDSTTGQPVETYRYTAFGEEIIFNEKGQNISDSQVGNPWRFVSKRKDPETNWIFFGRRYYEPETGRWITPDPIGYADGPNLYAYLHHNPLNHFDAAGYFGKAMSDFCKPEFIKDYFPNIFDESSSDRFTARPEQSSHHEDRAGYIGQGYATTARNITGGVVHGGANFVANQCSDIASYMCLIGSQEWEDSFEERLNFQATFSNWQDAQMSTFDNWVGGCIGCHPNNSAYQIARTYTTIGLEVGTLAVGAYGAVKGVVSLAKVSRAFMQGSKIAGKVATRKIKLNIF